MVDAERLFAAHREGLFRYLCRIVGRAEAAQDLTQEVFVRVVRTAVPTEDPAGSRAWLFRIARNLALNHLRDARRRPEPAVLLDRAQPAVQELGVALTEALNALSEADRDVFLLRETAGLSYAEIGVACELSVDAVRARLHRARVELRTTLGDAIGRHRRRPVSLHHGERT
ncbi:MAG TPA: RNA polymerase sigma factor [Vicinamibacterales bacterium]|nr:RNA polymerase sigma factor [Vicinamibacterales bacterium]